LGKPSRKIFRGQKHVKFGPISVDFKVWRPISPERIKIFNRRVTRSTTILPALGETSPVKFGPMTLEISMLTRTHSKCIFQKIIFRPLRVLRPQIFTRARESPSLTSAPPTGDGGPFYIFLKGGSKIGFKCSVLAAKTLKPKGVASWNFATWRAARWER